MGIETPPVGAEGPCTVCPHKPGCPPYALLRRSLFAARSYASPPPLDAVDRALDSLIETFIATMKRQEQYGIISSDERGRHLSALFDLAVTGIYTNNLFAGANEFSQQALLTGKDTAFFPYTWMDPRSLVLGQPLSKCYLPGARREDERDYPIASLLAKPGGRFIGDVGIKVLKAIVRRILLSNRPHARLRDGGGLRGEFDLTITDAEHLIFIEVKAKPLISYPLKLLLKSPRTTSDLSWQHVQMSDVLSFSLFLAASNADITLSRPNETEFATWPFSDLKEAAADDSQFLTILRNWIKHLEGYRAWDDEPRDTRWHRFGCGNFATIENGIRIEKRVANTKELPGLDRTDDIKKGAAQLLKFSRFKFDCSKRAIRCVLMGNTHSETHAENYLEPLVSLKIVRDGDPNRREEWIFDAVVGLTKNNVNNADLNAFFDLNAL